jgi:hypothetical protein
MWSIRFNCCAELEGETAERLPDQKRWNTGVHCRTPSAPGRRLQATAASCPATVRYGTSVPPVSGSSPGPAAWASARGAPTLRLPGKARRSAARLLRRGDHSPPRGGGRQCDPAPLLDGTHSPNWLHPSDPVSSAVWLAERLRYAMKEKPEDILPDYVLRFLSLPISERGTPDCQRTISWLLDQLERSTAVIEMIEKDGISQVARSLPYEAFARSLVALRGVTDQKQQDLVIKAANYDHLMSEALNKSIKIKRTKRGPKPKIGVFEDWPILIAFRDKCGGNSQAASEMAGMQWRIENPRSKKPTDEKLAALAKNIEMRFRRAPKLPELFDVSEPAVMTDDELQSRVEQIVREKIASESVTG